MHFHGRFNHVVSAECCIEDYRDARSRWWGWSGVLPGVFGDGCRVQPTALRFRGQHKLQVRSAPEPKNVKWINLHTSDAERFARRMVTTLLTVALLATSFLVIYSAKLQPVGFLQSTVSD